MVGQNEQEDILLLKVTEKLPPVNIFSNIFSSETTWPINAKFHEKPTWVWGSKFGVKSRYLVVFAASHYVRSVFIHVVFSHTTLEQRNSLLEVE